MVHNNWKQAGSNVRYWQETADAKKHYILSFDFEFKHEGDEVFVAACPPYSYSYLKKRIESWANPSINNSQIFSVGTLSHSVCGLEVPILTVSSSHQTDKKQYVVIIARSHPGETAGSWVTDGLL